MSNSISVSAKTLWQIGVVGIVLWSTPSCLSSQETSFSRQAHANAGEAFAGFNDSLTRAAETLLDSAVQTTSAATGKISTDKAAVIAVAPQNDLEQRPWVETGSTVAELRVSLLRPAVEPILRSHGVPTDMAAVILVESGGRATALSPKGARGLWQLMPDTARRYGLRVDEIQDDRLDLFKATDAAARYLHDLYAQFGDWRLALAAYNTGEANVGSAILRAHTQDFDQLINLRMLPLETRNYVPRVLAAAQSVGQTSTFAKSHDVTIATTVFAKSNP
jgi:soluble lytic murein transglycosylase-like protein